VEIKNVSVLNSNDDIKTVSFYGGLYGRRVDKRMRIYFTLDEMKLVLIIYKLNGAWYPATVRHFHNTYEKTCLLCGDSANPFSSNCQFFKDKMNDIFESVMNDPNIRLEKLFW
jgi:hypothetical protein